LSAVADAARGDAVGDARVSDTAVVRPAARLRGTLRLPGDKSISHRALLLAALASGTSRISDAGDGEDVRTTARLIAAIGADVSRDDGAHGRAHYEVRSPGVAGLVEPEDVLDCGNSGTSLRLLAGILAGQPWTSVLTGDASLRQRPVARVATPLREMGATVEARRRGTLPPVSITGRVPLRAIDYATPVPSAQVKSAVLLAGLFADGTTTVTESVATRDHSERMLRARGVTLFTAASGEGGARVAIAGGQTVLSRDERVPGDVSAAAFWLVAAAIHPDADLVLDGVGLNATRTAILELLARMGADITVEPAASTTDEGAGEPLGTIRVRSSFLRAIDVAPSEVAAAIDEIPILCLAATQAAGTTTIRGVGELRVKESDRVAGIVDGLRSLGANVDVDGDDLSITGSMVLQGAATDSRLDHRLAMTFAVAGLIARGQTSIVGASSASISYPAFFDDLEGVQA
jgi:3-phosphoshikimate 1-carboxyvinyltransferase